MAGPAEDALTIRRKRLIYLSWHRGTRETDLLLGPFADRHVPELTPAQLDRYEALLECPDGDIFDWISRAVAPPAVHDSDVMRLLWRFSSDK